MTNVNRAPRFEAVEAGEIARRHYGFKGKASPLPSERDQNFLLTSATGEKRVLKIANPEEKPENLDLQNEAMARLASGDEPVPASVIFPAEDGRLIVEAADKDGVAHAVRMVSYIEGTPLGAIAPQTPELLTDLGRFVGRLTNRLASFDHPAARRDFYWDVRNGERVVEESLPLVPEPDRSDLAGFLLERAATILRPLWNRLPKSVVFNDANDYNVIVARPGVDPFERLRIAGLIDFGDMVRSVTAAEPAVACAYVMLGKDEPLAAAAAVVSGYHAVHPLDDLDLEALYPLIVLRLLMSVAICARQSSERPDNDYLKISNASAWALLDRMRAIPPRFVQYTFRNACGLSPHPAAPRLRDWLKLTEASGGFAPVTGGALKTGPKVVFDLSVGSLLFANPDVVRDPEEWGRILFAEMEGKNAKLGIGRYDEARLVYASNAFRPAGRPLAEGRTVHIGLDVFAAVGSSVRAPADGIVKFARDNDERLDYGPTIILEHRTDVAAPGGGPLVFYTLYGHLGRGSLAGMEPGRQIIKGERIGDVGAREENGNWPPHLHFQIILDLFDECGNYPGVCRASERDVWLSVCPDPNFMLGTDLAESAAPGLTPEAILARRKEHLGPSLSVAYRRPLKIVRGFMQHLYDHAGRMYLDAVNNVPHVGHGHPRVVAAVQGQAAVLNTNTRYLHDTLARYIERLTATLPAPLQVCYLVNSGSEANDLALRLARHYTGRRDMVVLSGAYHGHLTSLIEISPYKFGAKGGSGRPPHTQVAEMPDVFRGIYRKGDPDAGRKYADAVGACLERIEAEGRRPAGFIAESLLSCGGQIVLPDGYLKEAYRRVRAAGGVCLADEVQVGFGRVGSHFWGFETQGVVPDIVTMGKPIGNGFPLAAVVTTRPIADAFATGPEYFNTYGGNPVSLAAGQAVLDVLRDERLQDNALRVGSVLKAGLKGLQLDHVLIGDVRGLGLFLGIELVSDPEKRTPASGPAAYIAERMREEGVLLSTDGPDRNVLKIKPPLCFSTVDAELLVETLGRILGEEPLRR
ncbi:MAG: aminotransferase class III-fold pyridoxal phosphate-dependent enzyme [Candidatus Aminicenantales bacterium]